VKSLLKQEPPVVVLFWETVADHDKLVRIAYRLHDTLPLMHYYLEYAFGSIVALDFAHQLTLDWYGS